MQNGILYKYANTAAVDVVFCIDGSGSVNDVRDSGKSVVEIAKQKLKNIYSDFSDVCFERGRKLEQFRVRIIVFRDYIADGEHAMLATDFFQLPQQAAEFEACINSIHADGGGDIPEDGLEALAYAIKSKWTNVEGFKRHIIMVWTDADTHALGFGSRSSFYPKGMPNDLGELSDWWDDPAYINQRTTRLVLFAPDEGNWKYISDNWNLTLHIPVNKLATIDERQYKKLINHYIL